MNEHSKLYRTHENRKSYQLTKRLGAREKGDEEMKIEDQHVTKRKNQKMKSK